MKITGMKEKNKNALSIVLGIYIICFVFRAIEYFFLRTDQTVLGEAFVHKLIGITILFAAARYYGFSNKEIGFSNNKIFNSTENKTYYIDSQYYA